MNRPVHPLPQPLSRYLASMQGHGTALASADCELTFCHRLLAVPQEEVRRWLDQTAAPYPGMDDRAAAAFLGGNLAWELGLVLAGMRMGGFGVPALGADAFAARLVRQDGDGIGYARISVHILDDSMPHLPLDTQGVNTLLVAVLAPMVERLHILTRLGRSALWRLVADNIAAAWLSVGNSIGDPERAITDADAIIHQPGSPLSNKQLHFIRVEARDPQNGQKLLACEWFRARGGCCRYYTVDEARGQLCSTCVLQTPQAMQSILSDYLVERVQAGK